MLYLIVKKTSDTTVILNVIQGDFLGPTASLININDIADIFAV